MADFTETLAQLQTQNIGAGFILAAQANMMANQDEATKNTLALFNKSQQDLDNELRTTQQQLDELNNSDVMKDGKEDIEKMSARYQAMMEASIERQNKYQELYQKSIQDLITIGSEDSLKQAQNLENDLPYKLQNEKDRMAIPFQRLQFKKTMFDVELSKLNTEQAGITLQQLKQNIDVMDLVTNMMQLTDDKGNNYYADLVSNMGWNDKYGTINYKKRQDTFYKVIDNELAGNPLKGKVIQAFDLEFSKRIRNYSPPEPKIDTRGFERLQDDANYTVSLYGFLKNATYATGMIENSPDYSGTRKLYEDAAASYIKEKGITDINAIKEIMKFGSSKEVIKRTTALNPDSYLTAVRNDGLPTDHYKVMEMVNGLKYDKQSDNYYWDKLTEFKKKINAGEDFKIIPISELKSDIMGRKEFKRQVKTVKLMGQDVPFDLTSLMSNDSGWWNEYDPNTYTTVQSLQLPFLKAGNNPNTSNSNGYLTPQNMMVR